MKRLSLVIGSVIGASLIATAPVNAFWGGKAADQRKMILGTWSCKIKARGVYKGPLIFIYFKRNSKYFASYKVGNLEETTNAAWKINNESQLILKGGTRQTVNRNTGDIKQGTDSNTNHMNILTLTNSILEYEIEGGGAVFHCRK